MNMLLGLLTAGIMCLSGLNDFVGANTMVKSCVSATENDKAVIVVNPIPIFTISERKKLLEDIARETADKYNLNTVIVSYDSDIYVMVQNFKGEGIDEIIKITKSRGNSYEYCRDNYQQKIR